MSTRSKRIIYSEADCHTLVDIIISHKNIIECKKTDATTWKEKITAWAKIADIYNATTMEPRTAEQLRCKYDNLKKEVRKLEAHKRQALYQTGGGVSEPDIKDTLQQALEEDILFDNLPKETVAEQKNDIFKNSESEVKENEMLTETKKDPEIKKDWSDYTPKMLRSKRHRVLQVKRKATDHQSEDDKQNLKRKLMEEEAQRNKEYHIARMEREAEIHKYKIENIRLQNAKLQLEIELLKKQL
ncbi:unnamed protein product [Acanthoscelides obtectus]|uniref:Regulatory protein zeste n=2 Tax=Acanthoscelides obtectus TaxID=200917 RepID=A0A9P0Q5M6_ACAOB|nr:unnamed protein product [Acanthoscelides obtectus]CAH1974800.1 unnamed protein product [Acanthoscelides obtectus]CAH1995161.1 unnamed protein product [Acanthoscelides obtectus]CAH2009885.1 unnamed protein product [Acanthoscelides obtectus]CAH2011720.1 unnamed protein product [Acanthoscelides obtectus]